MKKHYKKDRRPQNKTSQNRRDHSTAVYWNTTKTGSIRALRSSGQVIYNFSDLFQISYFLRRPKFGASDQIYSHAKKINFGRTNRNNISWFFVLKHLISQSE